MHKSSPHLMISLTKVYMYMAQGVGINALPLLTAAFHGVTQRNGLQWECHFELRLERVLSIYIVWHIHR